jgi:hypothetical protein
LVVPVKDWSVLRTLIQLYLLTNYPLFQILNYKGIFLPWYIKYIWFFINFVLKNKKDYIYNTIFLCYKLFLINKCPLLLKLKNSWQWNGICH